MFTSPLSEATEHYSKAAEYPCGALLTYVLLVTMVSLRSFRDSPRFLTLQHAQNVKIQNAKKLNALTDQPPPLPPAGVKPPPKGQEQLYSSH